jgi:molybdopterin-biosynthesis enzyme MoeA-like protein
MAGVPSIMQAMLDEVAPKLNIGVRMLSESERADAREGDIGMQLGEIAKANPEVAIGSYPFFDPQHGPNTNVVLRARDAPKLEQAKREVEEMLERVRRTQSNSWTSPSHGENRGWVRWCLNAIQRAMVVKLSIR